MSRLNLTAIAFALLLAVCPRPARALPLYAHEYGFSCQQCHSIVPHLNDFGQAFLRAGFRLPPAVTMHRAFPLAVKVNLAFTSAPDPAHLPKALVDEVELLAGAPITAHINYRFEQYLVDGGIPGKTRDAWLQFTSAPTFASHVAALRVTAGQFTLPLPVDPETQRDTLNHYAVFDQRVGGNPFDFFDDRIGLDIAYGKSGGGADVHVLALKGHDPQSGLSTRGADRMIVAQTGSATTTFATYRYEGVRLLSEVDDRFWRQAFGVTRLAGKSTFDALLQTGSDCNATALASAVHSSGGFGQMRWAFSASLIGEIRYDETMDALAGAHHSLTTAAIIRSRRNERFTVEDVVTNGAHTLNAAWLFAF